MYGESKQNISYIWYKFVYLRRFYGSKTGKYHLYGKKTPFLFLKFYVFKNSRHYYVLFIQINWLDWDGRTLPNMYLVCCLFTSMQHFRYVLCQHFNTILKLIFTCTKKKLYKLKKLRTFLIFKIYTDETALQFVRRINCPTIVLSNNTV